MATIFLTSILRDLKVYLAGQVAKSTIFNNYGTKCIKLLKKNYGPQKIDYIRFEIKQNPQKICNNCSNHSYRDILKKIVTPVENHECQLSTYQRYTNYFRYN